METLVNSIFDKLPASARIWIYKSPKPFTPAQKEHILNHGEAFVSQWQAHGADLLAAIDIALEHFVILAVDEVQAKASGCSIDSSMGFIRKMETDLDLSLTERMFIIAELADGVKAIPLNELSTLHAEGRINSATPVFDDLVPTLGDLRKRFKLRLEESWAQRFV